MKFLTHFGHSIFVLLFILTGSLAVAQGVLISNSPGQPDPSSGLEVDFTDRGFLMPRLTTAQRNAIQNPAAGLQIYNLSTECVEVYFPTGWANLKCGCTQAPPSPQSITPPAVACPGDTALLYVVAPVSGANSYQWTVPQGMVVRSGQGSDSLFVDLNGPVNGTLTVVALNGCGSSAPFTFQANIQNPTASFTPLSVPVNSPTTFNPTNTNYANYAWVFQNGSPGSSNLTAPSVSWSQLGNYLVSLSVTDNNGCVDSDTQTVAAINCPTGNQTFSFTGAAQSFTVPSCVNSIVVDVRGAQGGSGYGPNTNYGGRVVCTLAVTPGEVLQINVGGQGGQSQGGWNGGGAGDAAGYGGGGASDIRRGGTSLNDRVVVAGGGGGGGFWSGSEVVGGKGGGLVGQAGFRAPNSAGGDGGTQSGSGTGTCSSTNNPIVSGGFGFGGTTVGNNCGCEGYGGGSGWYGGAASGNCRGGGGGSSYTDPNIATGVQHTQGSQVGNGSVTVSY